MPIKVLTVMGTRPELIRLSRIIPKLDENCDHKLVHTGQNYDQSLNDVFFDEMQIRKPNYCFGIQQLTFESQIAGILNAVGQALRVEKPDRVLILGDTNSGLATIIAERMGIPVYHMEAGNRCFDREVPEEINRRMIDSIASFNLPYTERSRENLLHDGVPKDKIFVTGNPIYEVIRYYRDQIQTSRIVRDMKLEEGKYILSTFHRSENVDNIDRLKNIVNALAQIAQSTKMPVVCSIHPRTKSKLEEFGMKVVHKDVIMHTPFGFFDFVKLEREACCVISDSGTVTEETCILKVPNVIIRKSTERPETIECGSSILSGLKEADIVNCTNLMLKRKREWEVPKGYRDADVSDKVLQILLGR